MAAPPASAPAKGGHGLILAGLMLGVLLFALDQTVVGTSLPKIVADVGGFEHFHWLFAAYMLGSTVVIPVAGKLSDIYGRRPVYITGMAVFLLGSALCGTAASMTQLIAYRGIQGLGGGALFPVAIATIADLYAPSERGRIQGLFGAVFGFSSVIGPFLGGWIVDTVHVLDIASWRWVFYVNLPVGFVAIPLVAAHFPRVERKQTTIDYAGIITLTLALVSGLLITVWGGDTYPWASGPIFGLATLSLASLAAFLWIETKAVDPVLPLTLFREPVFTVSAIATLLMGAAMFGVITFMPTFMQGVVGLSATNSGAVMMPLSLALMAASIVSGRMMAKHGYKIFTLVGTAMAAVGFFALSRLGHAPPIWLAIGEMVIIGTGLGFTIQTYIVAAQNAVPKRTVGVATSTLTLVRSLGATFGVTVLGVVLNRRLEAELPRQLAPPVLEGLKANPFIDGNVGRIPSLLLQPQFVERADPAVVESIKIAFTSALSTVFLLGMIIGLVGLAVSAFLRSQRLKTREEYHADEKLAPLPEP